MSWARALLGALLLCACGPAGGAPDASTRPLPAPVGTPLGSPTAADVGAPGAQLASEDGRLVLDIPAGVLEGMTVRVQQVTNTAPGAVGAAYRLEPEGQTFAAPVRLTFTVEADGPPLEALTVAWQEGQGYWLRLPESELVRDPAKRSITVNTRHFSGWTLVTGPTARDLHGTFALDSSLDVPFAGATGVADFTFAGEDPDVAFYLLAGTITLPSPLAVGANSCVPAAPETPSLSLRTNIAELRRSPTAFLWGLSGHWNLACTGPSGSSSELLLTAFDTQGIGALGCARGYDGGVVLGPDRVRGTYVIDCGSRGQATASFNFDSNACGSACPASLPCHTAVIDCGSGTGVCTDVGVVPDGEPGACPSPQTCLGGACVP